MSSKSTPIPWLASSDTRVCVARRCSPLDSHGHRWSVRHLPSTLRIKEPETGLEIRTQLFLLIFSWSRVEGSSRSPDSPALHTHPSRRPRAPARGVPRLRGTMPDEHARAWPAKAQSLPALGHSPRTVGDSSSSGSRDSSSGDGGSGEDRVPEPIAPGKSERESDCGWTCFAPRLIERLWRGWAGLL